MRGWRWVLVRAAGWFGRGAALGSCWAALGACAVTEGPLLRALSVEGGAGPDAGAGADAETPVLPSSMSFQYQLTGAIDTSVEAELFVVDLFAAPAETIASLRAEGRTVVAYLSAGTRESYRPDADEFPAAAVGNAHPAYPDEAWLDVRDAAVRALMTARLDRARDKGFDGVLPANLSAYTRDSGFPLSAGDQLAYTRFLTDEARARGLVSGMSGDYAQVAQLLGDFDFALQVGCVGRGDCEVLEPFVAQGKPAFDVEYEGELVELCQTAARHGVSVILKRPALDAFREACP